NVRGFALVTVDPGWKQRGAVPASARRIEGTVELWSSVSSMRRPDLVALEAWEQICDLVETATTRFAPVAEPESLARILPRLAKKAVILKDYLVDSSREGSHGRRFPGCGKNDFLFRRRARSGSRGIRAGCDDI